MADAGAARQALPEALRPRYTAEPFLTDRMADALVAADLVVGRAGLVDLRRGGRGRRGLDPGAVSRMPAPTSATTRSYLAERGRRESPSPTRSSTPTGWSTEATALRDDAARAFHGGGREDAGPARCRGRAGRRADRAGRAPRCGCGRERRRHDRHGRSSASMPLAVERGIELRDRRAAGAADHAARRWAGRAPRVTGDDRRAGRPLLRLAAEAGVPAFMLGKGSDIVVADAGIRGPRHSDRAPTRSASTAHAGPRRGRRSDGRARAALRPCRAWPASTGRSASPARSAARSGPTRGRTAARWPHVVREVERLRRGAAGAARLAAAECGFAYRESRFKHGDDVVLGGTIELESGDPTAIERAHRRPPGARAERRSRWPTRTRAASSATRRATTPVVSSRPPASRATASAARQRQHPPRELHRHRPRCRRAADVRALGDHVRATVADRFGVELALRDRVRRAMLAGGRAHEPAARRHLRRWPIG